MTKLFVGSLSYNVTSQQLNDLFAQFGAVVSASVVNDKFTGRSRGFGFVEMQNDEEAQKAISELNETEFDGRKIFVSVAKPREERPQGGGGGFRQDRDRRDNRGGGFGRDRR